MHWQGKYGRNTVLLLLTGVFLFYPPVLHAEDTPYSPNNFGGIGLLDMRTARFAPDGTIAVGAHYTSQELRFFSTWQATPWLETTLSYTDDRSEFPERDNLGVDRSLDVKIRLWSEGNFRPQLAVGIQDALGRGRFDGEYIVASKRYYDFDFTMGLAWGYLGSRGGLGNMFKLFGNSFDDRSATTSSGGIRSGSYFSGQNMSFFAGAEYHPPLKGLSIKVEYSGVDTRNIAGFSHLKRRSAFNFGLNYKPVSWADVAVGFDHGDRVTLRLTLKQNLHKLKIRKWFRMPAPAPILVRQKPEIPLGIGPEISPWVRDNDLLFDRLHRLGANVTDIEQNDAGVVVHVETTAKTDKNHLRLLGAILDKHDRATLFIRNQEPKILEFNATKNSIIGEAALEKFRNSTIYQRERQIQGGDGITAKAVYDMLAKAELSPIAVVVQDQQITVRKETGPHFSEIKNIGRTARILTREMPDHVEKFKIISQDGGVVVSEVSILRKDLEKASSYQGSPEEIWANSSIREPNGATADSVRDKDFYQSPEKLKFDWGLKPGILTHFGGNEDGRFRADLYAKLFASVQLMEKVTFSATLRQYIMGDIDQIPRDMRPDVPKVRSDIARYATEGRTALERLQFDYTAPMGGDLYARISGGILESMYGGLGAEILYRPYDRNFAFGVDMNWVKQRDFDQLFSFRDYDVFTGHATFYHENTNYDISSKLSVGRYLAGDYGATLDISRRFSNGMRIGVWATVTDMSSDDFGDGSFDKGIYLTMPLELFWHRPTDQDLRFNFRSLGKNGGQMLDGHKNLYDMLSPGSRHRIARDWHQILN